MAQTETPSSTVLLDLIRRSGRWSLPDWAFLPLAVLVTTGLIALALNIRPGTVEPVITDGTFVMEGEALGELIPGPGTRFELTFGPTGEPIARLERAGFFYPPEKTPLMMQNLINAFARGGLTQQEVRTLRGVIKALAIGRGKARVERE